MFLNGMFIVATSVASSLAAFAGCEPIEPPPADMVESSYGNCTPYNNNLVAYARGSADQLVMQGFRDGRWAQLASVANPVNGTQLVVSANTVIDWGGAGRTPVRAFMLNSSRMGLIDECILNWGG